MMISSTIRAPRKARAILDRMMLNRTVTPKGVEWLIAATDPFHDTELSVSGYPDISATRSLCQTVTKTFTVETPLSIPANWDAHVFFLPLTYAFGSSVASGVANNPGYYPTQMNMPGQINQAAINTLPTPLYGGVNVIGCAAGTAWNDVSADNQANVAFDPTFSTDTHRLIGCGFEVVNTTAELYKGGSVTSYRIPSQVSEYTVTNLNQALDISPVKFIVAPPMTQQGATLYPDSKTWAASEGVYSISTLNTTQNAYYTPAPSCGGVIVSPGTTMLTAATNTVGSQTMIWIPANGASNGGNPLARNCCTAMPWDVNGCVFSGLNTNTALTVTAKYYYERLPSPSNPQLLVLTKQPAPFDPIIMEIYARCMADLPIACPVGDNPLGEWFTEVLDTVAEWAPKIGNALGTIVPGAGLIGQGLGAGAAAWSKQQKWNKNKKAGAYKVQPLPQWAQRQGNKGPNWNKKFPAKQAVRQTAVAAAKKEVRRELEDLPPRRPRQVGVGGMTPAQRRRIQESPW